MEARLFPKNYWTILTRKKNNMKVLLLILLFSCMQSDSVFLDKVLNDFDSYSYFIALDVEAPNYNGKIIVENEDLYYIFQETKGVSNKEEYKAKVKEAIHNESTLSLNISDFEEWEIYRVLKSRTVNSVFAKGKDRFIAHYFDGRVLKDGISDDERNAIIEKLFEWEMPSKNDDETGYLVIDK